MPIKFRCPSCSQFLGISRASAGSVVDCPACGRSLRVPRTDGRVEPLPDPKLDLADPSLVEALERLADLQPSEESDAPFVIKSAPRVVQPSVAPAPVAVVIEPLEMQRVSIGTSAETRSATDDPLAVLAASAPTSLARQQSRKFFTRRDAAIAMVTAAAVWPVAWWMGRRPRSPEKLVDAEAKIDPAKTEQPAVAAEAPPEQPKPAAIVSVPALRGRITYIAADGEARADAGARILLLPESRPGTAKLSVAGFRAGASETDIHLARESLRLLGGGYAVADGEGRYEASLASSGAYHLLLISNYQERNSTSAMPADLSKTLADYFDRPTQLIGQTQYELGRLRYQGREASLRDHVFRRS